VSMSREQLIAAHKLSPITKSRPRRGRPHPPCQQKYTDQPLASLRTDTKYSVDRLGRSPEGDSIMEGGRFGSAGRIKAAFYRWAVRRDGLSQESLTAALGRPLPAISSSGLFPHPAFDRPIPLLARAPLALTLGFFFESADNPALRPARPMIGPKTTPKAGYSSSRSGKSR
jgi:hypothetical protein